MFITMTKFLGAKFPDQSCHVALKLIGMAATNGKIRWHMVDERISAAKSISMIVPSYDSCTGQASWAGEVPHLKYALVNTLWGKYMA
jgi:hypothetical protein